MKVLFFVVALLTALPALAQYRSVPFVVELQIQAADPKANGLLNDYLKDARAVGYEARVTSSGQGPILTIDAGKDHQVSEQRRNPNTLEVRVKVSRQFDRLLTRLKPYLALPVEDFCIGGSCHSYVYMVAP